MLAEATPSASMSTTITSGMRAERNPTTSTAATSTDELDAIAMTARLPPTVAQLTPITAPRRATVAKRGNSMLAPMPTRADAPAHADATDADSPESVSRTFGSHPLRPWFTKKMPIPRTNASWTPRLARITRHPPAAAAPPTGAGPGSRTRSPVFEDTSSHRTPEATATSEYTTTTQRQSPRAGSSSEFVIMSAVTPPSAGAAVYKPTARRRSEGSSNQVETNLGAEADTSGPPMPKIAIANQNDPRPWAEARANPDSATNEAPNVMDHRSPRRSMTRPAGGADTM